MSSNARTRTSPETKVVLNTTVIQFNTAPHYRNNDVDISNGNVLELYSIARLSGNNKGGIRAKVAHTEIPGERCDVLIEGCDFEVIVNYSGTVSIGIIGH